MYSEVEITSWYHQNLSKYQSLGQEVSILIEKLLDNKIAYHSVKFRVKELISIINKFKDKDYTKFTELTDFTGIRIITYTLSDVDRVCDIIDKEFKVKDKKDFKVELENTGKVGYISIQCLCEFKDAFFYKYQIYYFNLSYASVE